MRVREVQARGFGPLENQQLKLAEGMNIIFGPNEAGKSSWHAALYAGLCGRRRGQGQPSVEDRNFRDRHLPWNGARWGARVVVALADGRTVEIQQDLLHNVDCRATDVDLGRDLSSTIIFEGTPDGSRFLGLDRRSFLATACVRQTDLLQVRDNAEQLQEHLQRAADTASVDQTAAQALERLDDFERQQVGLDRSNSRGPLRAAQIAENDARQLLERARELRVAHLELAEEVERLAEQSHAARVQADALRAVLADRDAVDWGRRAAQARELIERAAAQGPVGAPDRELADAVAAALQAWRGRAVPPNLEGPSASELEAELASLPIVPVGDTEVDPAAASAAQAYQAALLSRDEHQSSRPGAAEPTVRTSASEQELRSLAADLTLPIPGPTSAVEERLRLAHEQLTALGEPKSQLGLFVAGGLSALSGAAALFFAQPVGIAPLVGGIALILWAAFAANRASKHRARAQEQVNTAQLAVTRDQVERVQAQERRAAAEVRVRTLGLPAEPSALEQLANDVAAAAQAGRDLAQWLRQEAALDTGIRRAEAALRTSLTARQIDPGTDALSAFRIYETACRRRASLALRSARRADLEGRLAERREMERTARAIGEAHRSAAAALRDLSVRCRVAGDSESALAHGLDAWRAQWIKEAALAQGVAMEQGQLAGLLDGSTIEQLVREASVRREQANELMASVHPEALGRVVVEPDAQAQLTRLNEQAHAARELYDHTQGRLEEGVARLINIPDAEVGLEAARAEVHRVLELQRILALTRAHLEQAQQRVHQDIAPVLSQSVTHWLPTVTRGRYLEARVSPETLEVQVRSAVGDWRPADRLSHGTAEQIYLLLRVALATHLTKVGEVCPLVMDDPTVHADEERTWAILDTLHRISRERQVILFTQEHEVLAWASNHLSGERDRLTELSERLPVI